MHTGEDPFNLTLDPNAHGKEIKTKSYYYGEEVGYWNHGDTALIVNTPKYGRKVFTGKTHMPTPSKVRWVTNVNILNNAKHHYDMVRNVDPNIEMIVTQDIEMTSDVNHADIAFAVNSWMEFTYPEMTVTVSNPWMQIWKGGIRPLYDTRNDADTFAGVAAKLSEMTGDKRMRDLFKFVYENRVDVYAQRMLDAVEHLLRLQRRRHAEVGKGLDGDDAHLSAPSVLGRDQRVEAACGRGPGGTRTTASSRKRSSTAKTSCAPGGAGSDAVSAERDHDSNNPYIRPDDYGIPITAQHHDDKTGAEHQAAVGRRSSGMRTRCGRRGTSSTA